jgi:hypothetical protein
MVFLVNGMVQVVVEQIQLALIVQLQVVMVEMVGMVDQEIMVVEVMVEVELLLWYYNNFYNQINVILIKVHLFYI